jgi:hypothetical protein
MTIFCLGCSWTAGHGVKEEESYPAHLQNFIKKDVYNAGFGGTDISHAIWTGYRIIQEYKDCEIFLLQLSTLDRHTFVSDGKDNFLDYEHYSGNEPYIYDNSDVDTKYKRIYNVHAEMKFTFLTKGQYLESQAYRSKKGHTGLEKDIMMTYFFENILFSDYNTFQLYSYIDLFKTYCESKNIKLIIFSWLDSPKILRPLMTNTKPIIETFGEGYIIDNGYHYNSEGLQLIAEEYVYPMIKDFV